MRYAESQPRLYYIFQLDIHKVLGLSDDAIENIKRVIKKVFVDKEASQSVVNQFLTNVNFERLVDVLISLPQDIGKLRALNHEKDFRQIKVQEYDHMQEIRAVIKEHVPDKPELLDYIQNPAHVIDARFRMACKTAEQIIESIIGERAKYYKDEFLDWFTEQEAANAKEE